MQQTLVVSGFSLAQADHGGASGERRSDAETDSTRSRSSIGTTITGPWPAATPPTVKGLLRNKLAPEPPSAAVDLPANFFRPAP